MEKDIKLVLQLEKKFTAIVFIEDNANYIPKKRKIKRVIISKWNGRSQDSELRKIAETLEI
jgi:hypothetical protein